MTLARNVRTVRGPGVGEGDVVSEEWSGGAARGPNVAVVFGGGVGRRMNNRGTPKQFLQLHDKPIIVHTLERFEEHPLVDHVAVVCVEPWIPHLERLVARFQLEKVRWVVPGGPTGQLSIYAGLQAVEKDLGELNPAVLVHDAVRPLLSSSTITANIESVRERGSAVTVTEARETVLLESADHAVESVTDRVRTRVAKAPQSFLLDDLLAVHRQALAEGVDDTVDSCSLMVRYGRPVHVVRGGHENIKITTPEDFYVFRALSDLRESIDILGL